MPPAPQSAGRHERNKQVELDRISAATREPFADRGVDEVTNQQIADEADIGTATLFLAAKTKGEREMVFGDPTEPRHQQALAVTARTEEAIAHMGRAGRLNESDVATLARVASAVLFLARAASVNATASVDEVPRDIRDQPVVVLPRRRR